MLRAYRFPRVRFPGLRRFCPYTQPDEILPFPPVVRCHQRSAVVSAERCGRHAQRDVHAGLGSSGVGRFREASGASRLMLLFHIVNGMAGGMVGYGLRMAGCADNCGVLSVGYGQEYAGHFAQDVAAAVCLSDNDALHYGITGALLACAVIFLYDGTRGFIHGNVAKYGFYVFYPAHLFFLIICQSLF